MSYKDEWLMSEPNDDIDEDFPRQPTEEFLPGNMQNSDQFQLEGHTYTVSRQNPRLDGLEVLVGIPTDQLSNIRATLLKRVHEDDM